MNKTDLMAVPEGYTPWPQERVGRPTPTDCKVGIVVARFNQYIGMRLLMGCLDTLQSEGVAKENISVIWVPGAYELPLIAQKLAKTGRYDGIICLGAVVRGDTPHFDYVAGEAARGIMDVGLSHDLPVLFGVLTTDTVAQALARSEGDANKGVDMALGVLELIALSRKL